MTIHKIKPKGGANICTVPVESDVPEYLLVCIGPKLQNGVRFGFK